MVELAALGACANTFALKNDDFEDRVYAQKAIYLVQLFGMDLGYRYAWDVRGPYCRELAQDLDVVFENGLNARYSLSSKGLARAKCVVDLIDKTPDQLDKVHWLELLASLHFLRHIRFGMTIEVQKANKVLAEEKPRLGSKELLKQAWSALESVGLEKELLF